MRMHISEIRDRLIEKGLKVTPQRLAILEAIYTLNNHPSAEKILDYIKDSHPGISSATIYKVLDALEDNQLIKRVKTNREIKRYDGVIEHHHHLYSSDSDEIKDYVNAELDKHLEDFFKKHKIDGFAIEEIKLQISGKFIDSDNQ
jgi:Fur family peroxide stress response transcriptional regulator